MESAMKHEGYIPSRSARSGKTHPNFPLKNPGGFTTIELLLVIGIVAVLGTVSLVNLVGWRNEKQLSSTAQKIATLVREAESRAMSQDRGAAWGVHFENSTTTGGSFFSIFYSGNYDPAKEIERYPIPASLAYDPDLAILGVDPVSGEPYMKDIVFDQISGRPKISAKYTKADLRSWLTESSGNTGGGLLRRRVIGVTYTTVTTPNLSLIAVQAINGNARSSVIVDPTGTIAFDSFSCILTCQVRQVVLLPPPVILSFSATPASTTPMSSVTLSWNTTQTDSCSGAPWMSGNATSGSETVTPSQTATYTLVCAGGGTEVSSAVTVEVVAGGSTEKGGEVRGGRGRQE